MDKRSNVDVTTNAGRSVSVIAGARPKPDVKVEVDFQLERASSSSSQVESKSYSDGQVEHEYGQQGTHSTSVSLDAQLVQA